MSQVQHPLARWTFRSLLERHLARSIAGGTACARRRFGVAPRHLDLPVEWAAPGESGPSGTASTAAPPQLTAAPLQLTPKASSAFPPPSHHTHPFHSALAALAHRRLRSTLSPNRRPPPTLPPIAVTFCICHDWSKALRPHRSPRARGLGTSALSHRHWCSVILGSMLGAGSF